MTRAELGVIDFPDFIRKLGAAVSGFMSSHEFMVFEKDLVSKGRNTCVKCGSLANKIVPLKLEYLEDKSTFPFHYVLMCEKCALKYMDEYLLRQIKKVK